MDIISSVSTSIALAKRLRQISKNVSEAEFQNVIADLLTELSTLKIDVATLKEENFTLRQENEKLTNKEEDKKQTLSNLAKLLESQKIQFPDFLIENGKTDNDLFSILVNMQKELIIGVSNRHSQNDEIYWLFYQVCPKYELYGVANKIGTPNSDVQKFVLSDLGKELLNAYYKQKINKGSQPKN